MWNYMSLGAQQRVLRVHSLVLQNLWRIAPVAMYLALIASAALPQWL